MKWALCFSVVALPTAAAEVTINTERTDGVATFAFKNIGSPQRGDAAKEATFSVLSGAIDPNSGGISVLNDGQLPTEEDAPNRNFFFAAGSKGGRVLVDLGKLVKVGEVRTFSWHPAERGPQVYKLYARDQAAADPKEAQAGDLESLGWRHLASVDTRKAGGGQHGVSIRDKNASELGDFRYLIFDIGLTEEGNPFGHTFFSEIDVIATGATEEKPEARAVQSIVKEVEFGKFHFTFDTSIAPDLTEWTDEKLVPVIKEWYPKLVEMLPSEGFEAPTRITVRFRDDMRGTPASAGGSRINCNAGWFRNNLKGEALGAVVHEMVHIVQNYGYGRRNNPDARRVPGWIVEGIPDYIRWFLYEPETRGAEITSRNFERARYDANYRISGNFLDWVARKHSQNVIWKINAAAREGKYSDEIWTTLTGQPVAELGKAWRTEHEERLKKSSGS